MKFLLITNSTMNNHLFTDRTVRAKRLYMNEVPQKNKLLRDCFQCPGSLSKPVTVEPKIISTHARGQNGLDSEEVITIKPNRTGMQHLVVQ